MAMASLHIFDFKLMFISPDIWILFTS